MNFEETLITAIDLEEKIRNIYQENAEKLKSPIATKVFTMLAEEENGHVLYLKRKLEQWKRSGQISEERMRSALPDKALIENQLRDSGYTSDTVNSDEEVSIFKQALEMEIKISKFYRGLIPSLPDDKKMLFQDFVEVEECHEAVIQAEISSAVGSGVWFDFMEFDQEAG